MTEGDTVGILSDVEPELIPELPQFFDNYQDDIDQLKQSLEDRDGDSIKSTAHRIKGSSGSWGFQNIHKAAVKLEEASKNSDWDGMKTHLNTLEQRIADARSAVKDELED